MQQWEGSCCIWYVLTDGCSTNEDPAHVRRCQHPCFDATATVHLTPGRAAGEHPQSVLGKYA